MVANDEDHELVEELKALGFSPIMRFVLAYINHIKSAHENETLYLKIRVILIGESKDYK